ncbi:unnamed protein product [Paramecium octaurelia]|uniref:Uncharacterized protein n=1 Tax=Paramecium octaurelia TaxID=43137 RepID=A0A8S1W5I8_PAROT|nr:unnamed protein product [Paramecium octaurelia]
MNQNRSFNDPYPQENEESQFSRPEDQGLQNQETTNENPDQENNITNNEQKQVSTQEAESTQTKDEDVVQITQLMNRKAIQLRQDMKTCNKNMKKQKFTIFFKLLWQILKKKEKEILIRYISQEKKIGLITIDTHQKVSLMQEDIGKLSFNLIKVNEMLKELQIQYQFSRIFQYDEQMKKQIQSITQELKNKLENSNIAKESIEEVMTNVEELIKLSDEILVRKDKNEQKNIFSFRKKDFNKLWGQMESQFLELKSELNDVNKCHGLFEKILDSSQSNQEESNYKKRKRVIKKIKKQTLKLINEKEDASIKNQDRLQITQGQFNKQKQSQIKCNGEQKENKQDNQVSKCLKSEENFFSESSQQQLIGEEQLDDYQDTPSNIFQIKKKTNTLEDQQNVSLSELDRELYFENGQQFIQHGQMEIEYEGKNNFEKEKKGKERNDRKERKVKQRKIKKQKKRNQKSNPYQNYKINQRNSSKKDCKMKNEK